MATKKITELPLVERVSGSQVAGGSVLPIVIGGGLQATTNRISVENFSKFVTQYSAHTGSVGNTFAGPQTFNSSSTFNDNVTINGKLTVTELVAIYETASVIFSSGSNIFGDKWDDVHTFTGSLIYNNVLVTNIDANTINRLQQATASLNTFTSSQADRNLVLSTVTGSINQATESIQFQTASLLAFTASQDSRNFTLSQVTGSFNYFYQATASLELASASFNYFYQSTASLQAFTASQADRNLVLSIVTGSINQATASLQFHSASVEAQLARIQQATASLELASASFNYFYQSTASLQTFTASQADRNLVLSIVTGSINQATASIQFQTASLLAFTASQDSRNLTLSTVTGSLIGITNGLMAFTAALDNTYATDAQLYQLYQATASLQAFTSSQADRNLVLSTVTGSINQATASIQFQTASLLQFTASQDSRNFTLSQVTGSFRGEIGGIEAYTASLKTAAIVSSSTQVQNYDIFALNSNLYISTGSLIGITNGLMAFTAALDNTYATDAQLYQLYQATRSLELTTGSLIGITNGLMAFTAALDNTYATDAQLYQLYAETASIKAEIGGIELYTASLKAASIVSSSTQVQNYDVFALNSNLYNGTGSIKGEIAGIEAYTASLKGAAIVSSSQQVQNYFTFAQTSSANTFYGTQTIKNNSGGTQGIDFQNYSTSGVLGQIIYSQSDDTLNIVNTSAFAAGGIVLKTNSTEKLRVATSGRLGLEVPTPDINTKLHIADTANGYVGIRLSGSGNFTGTDWTLYASSDSAPSANDFFGIYNNSATDGATEDYKLKVYKNGNVNIVNGNLVIGTSGNGIDFSATTNTAGTTSELLNDYETGTWTPAWNSTGGTITTISAQTTGVYTKIGNVVHIWARLYTNSVSSPTGEVTVSGLPFTVGSQVGNKAMHLFTLTAITGTLTGTPVIAFNDTNTTATIYNKIWNSTEFGGDIATYFDNDTWGYFYGTYLV